MMRKQKITRLFESRKGHLEARLKKDFVDNGIATIPCRINDFHDVISPFSVKKYETLNPDFADYLYLAADVTPSDSPLVVYIIEDFLSEEEKKDVRETIQEYFAYKLGLVEKRERRHTKTFIFMSVGLVVSGILLWLSQILEEVPRELFFFLFWFMGDTLCDYLFLTGHELRHERRTAGRLASIKVIFADAYDDSGYSESEVEELYSEIEKDIKTTLK